MNDLDVLVVGGGAAGLFTAHQLRRRGARVTVVERGPIGGDQSCSAGNTGFAGTQGSAPLAVPGAGSLRRLLDPAGSPHLRPRPDPGLWRWVRDFRRACTEEAASTSSRVLYALKKHSLALLAELDSAHFHAPGIVLAYRSPEGFERAAAAAARSPVPLRVLFPAELAELEPDTEFAVAGALYNEEGAYLEVPRFLHAFARDLAEDGVEILDRTEVTGFELSGGKVVSVRVPGRELRPGTVVLAAGSWTASLARLLGQRIALQPVKGYSVTVKTPPGAPRLPVLLPEGPVAVSPLDGELRFAGSLELTGMDRRIVPRRVAAMLAPVRSCLPALDLTGEQRVWAGLRPCAPDGLPYVGPAPAVDNLFLCCGHGHIGMGLAPSTGRLLAQLLTGERPDLDLRPFRIDR
ncbi:NAD(P)/FAD-dependent oxidoreductase [Actinocorallia aurantiaca]|uniref:FAD-dependent oxidoreductase n=1 Tax=Actinocorallia aurantiaca TaxID=46204 RepID=A0ABN3TZG5_9ACTN